MNSLERIDIQGNRFKYFPTELLALPNLEEIDISTNNISLLPDELLKLPKLNLLMLRNNKLLFEGSNRSKNLNLIQQLSDKKVIVKYLMLD
jgi:Leucine-rich repeat (LRR) protein